MFSNLKILRTLVILFFILSLVLICSSFNIALTSMFSSSYYAVYMESGEIYIGKLSYFPALTLSNVYLLVRIEENNAGSPYALHRLRDEEWGPSDSIKINSKKILWMTKLKDDGQAMKAIQGEISGSPSVSDAPIVSPQ